MANSIESNIDKPLYAGVVYAGGTISSLATAAGYREGGHEVDLIGQLARHRPNFKPGLTLADPVTAYTGLSENIQPKDWLQIEHDVMSQLRNNVVGVVTTHGTDSMEQTARYLQKRLGADLASSAQKVILTGANDDISVPHTDAWDNLAFALESITSDVPGGVYVAFHNRLIPADLVVKEPFDGIAMNYAFKDDARYLATIADVATSTQLHIAELEKRFGTRYQTNIANYRVNRYRPNNQALMNRVRRGQIGAVLLTLYHSGTAHTEDQKLSVARLARTLWSQYEVPSFAVTENGESVNFGGYETSVRLVESGIVPLGNAVAAVALAKLRLLSRSSTPDELVANMQEV